VRRHKIEILTNRPLTKQDQADLTAAIYYTEVGRNSIRIRAHRNGAMVDLRPGIDPASAAESSRGPLTILGPPRTNYDFIVR